MSYPLNHLLGYSVLPRDLVNLEALIRDPAAVQIYVVLTLRVSHKARWAGGSRGEVYLEAGQCVVGIREIAELLEINKGVVSRVLIKLEKLGLIARKPGHLGTLVTLRRYAQFGPGADAGPDTGQDTDRDTGQDTDRDDGRDPERDLTNGKREKGNGKPGDAGAREVPHLPTEQELRAEARRRALDAYAYLARQAGMLEGVAGVPAFELTPGASYLEDCGLVAAAAKYSAAQLRHVIDVRIVEAQQKRAGRWLNAAGMFKPAAIAYALGVPRPSAGANGTARPSTNGVRLVTADEVKI